jgi:hypothetical protein
MKHKLSLTNGSAILLKSILQVGEALTGVKEKVAAGNVVDNHLSEIPDPGKDKSMNQVEKWAKKSWKEVEISEGERDALKKAVSFCAEKGLLPNGAHFNSLVTQLGLLD